MMPVPPPATGFDMDFYFPATDTMSCGNNGITNISATAIIGPTRINYPNRAIIFSYKFCLPRQVFLPDFCDQAFR
jgi:hypothetical protein